MNKSSTITALVLGTVISVLVSDLAFAAKKKSNSLYYRTAPVQTNYMTPFEFGARERGPINVFGPEVNGG